MELKYSYSLKTVLEQYRKLVGSNFAGIYDPILLHQERNPTLSPMLGLQPCYRLQHYCQESSQLRRSCPVLEVLKIEVTLKAFQRVMG